MMTASALITALGGLWMMLQLPQVTLSDTNSSLRQSNSCCPHTSAPFSCQCVATNSLHDFVCTLWTSSGPLPQPMPSTTLLDISTNDTASFSFRTLKISGINLSNIGEQFLEGVSSVKILRVHNCQLKRVPRAFLQLPGLQVIDLSNNNLTSFSMDSIAYLSVSHLKLSENNLQQIDVTSAFSASLISLDVCHNHLKKMPAILWDHLRELYISHNALSALPNVTSSKMVVLDVSYNRLTQFPEHFLRTTPLLQTLRMASNQISQWGSLPCHFKLAYLKELDISQNRLEFMSTSLLSFSPQLTHLDLSQNMLSQLSETHFSSSDTNLRTLNLSHNQLHHLHPATFLHLQHLHTLNLSYNIPLGHRGLNHLLFPEYLVSVDLTNCSLVEVNFCQLHRLKHLKDVHLNHNPLLCSCQLHLLYQRNHILHKGAQTTENMVWDCVSKPSGQLSSAALLPPNCSLNIMQCSDVMPLLSLSSEVKAAIKVVLVQHYLIISWTLPDNLPPVTGFRVLCLGQPHSIQNVTYISPLLGASLRTFTVTDFDANIHPDVCVDVMHNQTHTLQRVCTMVHKPSPKQNVLVGILAGSIFLTPCLIFVIYITVKDTKIKERYEQSNQEED